MANHKKQYEQKRDRILKNKKLSDLKKTSMLFNLWMDYISKCVNSVESPKLESEKIRVFN